MLMRNVFTRKNIQLLKDWGEKDKDIEQIKRAYKKLKLYDENNERIHKDEAIKKIGIKEFLSGLVRASFHFTAFREYENGKGILFDCSDLFC